MAKAAKAPAKKTSPVVWAGLAAACVAVYILTTPSDTPASGVTSAKKAKKATAKNAGVITEADYKAQEKPFAPLTMAPVDAFKPLVTKPAKLVSLPTSLNKGVGGVPTTLTGGEANWYYTGCPALNGVREALLENSTTGESVYLRAGDAWKDARIQSVDVSAVTLVGRDGTAIRVPIQGYDQVPGVAPKPLLASNAPLAVPGAALAGAIGAGVPGAGGAIGVRPMSGPQTITLSNGQILQLPAEVGANGATLTATPDTNQGVEAADDANRNNQDSGDPNNGF